MSLTSAFAATPESLLEFNAAAEAVAKAACTGLTRVPKTLPPWLFYDEPGSLLFEEITRLPEYYLTRTERALLQHHASEILNSCIPDSCIPNKTVSVVELGAGTATKTGVLLSALAQRQPKVIYQPIDISRSALDEASQSLTEIPGLIVAPSVANYITDQVAISRMPGERLLALYIGSSIGNFSPEEARNILLNLRENLQPGDFLLLGTDLAPSASKSIDVLLAAYNDPAGVTAAFNRNILERLNRELRANFRIDRFRHYAVWNAAESRIEMHLQSTCSQRVRLPATPFTPAVNLSFAAGETIHTENSHKFDRDSISGMLLDSGFAPQRTFLDDQGLFAVTLASTG